MVSRHQNDPSLELADEAKGGVELAHDDVAEHPHLVVGADGPVPSVDEEGVEPSLGGVVGGTVEWFHSSSSGAPGLIAGDVAVAQVEVGSEEASHDILLPFVQPGLQRLRGMWRPAWVKSASSVSNMRLLEMQIWAISASTESSCTPARRHVRHKLEASA